METWSLPNSCRRTRAVTSARLRTSWPPEKRPPFSYRFTVSYAETLLLCCTATTTRDMTHTPAFWYDSSRHSIDSNIDSSSIYPHGRRAQLLLCLLHVCHPLRIKGNKRRMGWVTFSVPVRRGQKDVEKYWMMHVRWVKLDFSYFNNNSSSLSLCVYIPWWREEELCILATNASVHANSYLLNYTLSL